MGFPGILRNFHGGEKVTADQANHKHYLVVSGWDILGLYASGKGPHEVARSRTENLKGAERRPKGKQTQICLRRWNDRPPYLSNEHLRSTFTAANFTRNAAIELHTSDPRIPLGIANSTLRPRTRPRWGICA